MLEVVDLHKAYDTPHGPLAILTGAALSLAPGDSASIMGASGSGKSTLLYIVGGLDRPTSGRVTLDGVDPHTLSPNDLATFRNKSIGFVFQDHCLLPQCSVLENVLAPTIVTGTTADDIARAKNLVARVGLQARETHRPAALSGGEKQRVAIARALIRKPRLLLCDEPTGNLDKRSAEAVSSLLFELHAQLGTILLLVTHNPDLARQCGQQYELADGHLRRRDGASVTSAPVGESITGSRATACDRFNSFIAVSRTTGGPTSRSWPAWPSLSQCSPGRSSSANPCARACASWRWDGSDSTDHLIASTQFFRQALAGDLTGTPAFKSCCSSAYGLIAVDGLVTSGEAGGRTARGRRGDLWGRRWLLEVSRPPIAGHAASA